MSSRPSAFDALMSGARAAAAKRKPQTSSPKKRKTLDPSLNSTPKENSQLLSKPESPTPSPAPESKPEKEKESGEHSSNGAELAPTAKKVCAAAGVEERTAQLTSRIELLKKKALDFDPKLVATWDKGERVPFIFVALAFDLIAKESGRIVITDIVCNMLRTVMHTTPEDLVAVVYLAANKIAPAHEGLELGIGDSSIIKALAQACGKSEKDVKKRYDVCPFFISLFIVYIVGASFSFFFWVPSP